METVKAVDISARGMVCAMTPRKAALGSILMLIQLLMLQQTEAFPLSGDQTVLPPGTELYEETLRRPRELFHTEAVGGHKSYLINLGDLVFNSPAILGGTARQAEMSCGTCHVNGASNPKFFIPGLSTRPGNFDTTSLLFNPKAFNSLLDPVRIPSLRGARFLAPYGHDGRSSSLRDFVHNVIVDEFSGPEPAPPFSTRWWPTSRTSIFSPTHGLHRAAHSLHRPATPSAAARRCFSSHFRTSPI